MRTASSKIRSVLFLLSNPGAAGLLLLAACSVGPLLLLPLPATFYPSYSSWQAAWCGKCLIVVLLLGIIALRCRTDRSGKPMSGLLTLGLIILAAAFCACHWVLVDQHAVRADWQRELYLGILNHDADA